jgi:Zn-dependent peptidase ImmA (M78 family)
MRHREDEEFEEIARATRRRLGIEHQLQPDMVTVLFKLQQLGMITSYERVPDGQMPLDLGAFDPDSRIMHLRDSTFVAANDVIGRNPGRQRARFTIAHELGHVVLGHKKTRHRNTAGRPIEKIAPTIIRDESEADKFAASFLAPLYLAGNPLLAHAGQLAERFGLSNRAAEIRLEELQRLYRRAHNLPRPLPKSIVNFLENAKKRGAKIGSLDIEQQRRRAEAKANGYEGEMCGECGNFTLVRNGTCMKCDTCGSTKGCS